MLFRLHEAPLLITPLWPNINAGFVAKLECNIAMSAPTPLPETILRHFPLQTDCVRALVMRSPDFCDMCDELDAAETALSGIDRIAESQRTARRAECLEWIDRLVAEMTCALRADKIVPMRAAMAGTTGRKLEACSRTCTHIAAIPTRLQSQGDTTSTRSSIGPEDLGTADEV